MLGYLLRHSWKNFSSIDTGMWIYWGIALQSTREGESAFLLKTHSTHPTMTKASTSSDTLFTLGHAFLTRKSARTVTVSAI